MIEYRGNGKVEKMCVVNGVGDMVEKGFCKVSGCWGKKLFKEWMDNGERKEYRYEVKRECRGGIRWIGKVMRRWKYKGKV